jgi:hypothetical protein
MLMMQMHLITNTGCYNMDLKELFWWNNMKREIAKFVSECHTCQRVKAEHQSPAGLMQPLDIPE